MEFTVEDLRIMLLQQIGVDFLTSLALDQLDVNPFAEGHLYLQGENNIVGLAEASPAGYKEKGRFTIADKGLPSWAHPVVSGGRLYVRNQDSLVAYDIKAK